MIETNGNETLEQAIQAGDVKVDRNKPVIAPDKILIGEEIMWVLQRVAS